MKNLSFIIGLGILLTMFSCRSGKEYKDIGEHYVADYSVENDTYIFRNSETGRKLNGRILFRDRGYIDTNLIFKHYSSFAKGIQEGTDSVYRNDTLICVENYVRGLKNGEQITYSDSTQTLAHYEQDIIHGEELKFLNNVVIQRSNYQYGIKNGAEYEYNLQGEIEQTLEYELDTNESQIPYRKMMKIKIHNYKDSLVSIYDFITKNRTKFMGIITIYPSGNTWIWPDEVIHPSEVNKHCADCIFTGRYYIIELWGGDGLDQVWTNQWFAYTTRLDSEYEFVQIKSYP